LRVERCNRARPVVISCCNQQVPRIFAQDMYGTLEVNQHAFRFAICDIGIAPEIFTNP
jgi:uncharacterized protein CbrC (UPF0167 family)